MVGQFCVLSVDDLLRAEVDLSPPDVEAEALDMLASILLGGLTNAAQVIVSSRTPQDTRGQAESAIELLLGRLLSDTAEGRQRVWELCRWFLLRQWLG